MCSLSVFPKFPSARALIQPNLAVLYNHSIRPPFDATHTVWIVKRICLSFHICILFIVEVFQWLFLFALSRKLKTAWKHSTFCSKKTPSYHTVTPTISKECNGCVPKGEKSSLPGKVQTNCPL